jgi:uncharacterized protein YjgD (DUF1641 family)
MAELLAGREEAVKEILELLDLAKAKGLLKELNYFMHEVDELMDAGILAMTNPRALKFLELARGAVETVESLDGTVFPELARGANAMMRGMASPNAQIEIHGLLDLIKLLRDPDVNAALVTLFSGLKSFGAEVRMARSNE